MLGEGFCASYSGRQSPLSSGSPAPGRQWHGGLGPAWAGCHITPQGRGTSSPCLWPSWELCPPAAICPKGAAIIARVGRSPQRPLLPWKDSRSLPKAHQSAGCRSGRLLAQPVGRGTSPWDEELESQGGHPGSSPLVGRERRDHLGGSEHVRAQGVGRKDPEVW